MIEIVDEIIHDSIAGTRGLHPGPDCLCLVVDALLDGCLSRPELLRSLHADRGVKRLVDSRWRALLQSEMDAARGRDTLVASRIATMILLEVTRAEAQVRRPLPEKRSLLHELLRQVAATSDVERIQGSKHG